MEDLISIGRDFVHAMNDRRGIAQVDKMHAEQA